MFIEWHSWVAVHSKQNKIPKFEKELHAPYWNLNFKSPIFVNLQPINLLICKFLSKQNQFFFCLPVGLRCHPILRSHNFRHLKKQNMMCELECQCHTLLKYHQQNSLNQKFILWYDFNYQKIVFWPNKTCKKGPDMNYELSFVRFLEWFNS